MRAILAIAVYAPTAIGNAVPIRRIAGSRTRLNEPTSIAVDAEQSVKQTN